VNPEILSWARETAGFTLEAAAEALNIHESGGIAAVRRLAALETGEVAPTRPILRRMAEKYRRPLVAFYMSHIPKRGDRGEDFRSLPTGHPRASDALLDALVRDIRARQSMVRAILEDLDEAKPLAFIDSSSISDGIHAVVASIRRQLKLDLVSFRSHGGGRNQTTAEEDFGLLRSHAEAAGVFVLLIGNLGSHHTAIDLDTFRGFALADDVAPFVVINDQDAHAAWSFTLMHELAHLWLGETGVSGAQFGSPIERFCNDVAGEFLLPTEDLRELDVDSATSLDVAERRITTFANNRNVSRSMVAYKLYRVGTINQDTWRKLSSSFRQNWLQARTAKKESARDHEGGPNYYVVRRHRLGRALVELVRRTMADGILSPSKAGKVLGVKPVNVETLVNASNTQRSGRSV
jgi:Zn-dependent peptidase ImmA (M78 family)/transcriptional regulator with XRE-family HTH domain